MAAKQDICIPLPILAGLQDNAGALVGIRRGIEKECLRISADGGLSMRPHPPSLGSPLTHPQITTDFSEAQLELITAPHDTPEGCLGELEDIHRFVYHGLDDEMVWVASMPCLFIEDREIPLGKYGNSNIGMAKTIYRRGLEHRYGRLMQTISGIHYNFSLPSHFWHRYASLLGRSSDQAFVTEGYFGLIRNFRRYSWLLIYLFGASPAICRCFVNNNAHGLQSADAGTLYLAHATSLRMGRLGYQSDAQGSLHVSYNGMDSYADSLRTALTQPYPPYEKIGLKVNGEYRQLNTALLQIENEFYGTIRPKRRIHRGERPLTALKQRGVEYVEVRCLDINPFLPMGIDAEQMRFLDTFLLYCLLSPSRMDSPEESVAMQANQAALTERGREPGLQLNDGPMDQWAGAILEQCAAVANLLDEANGNRLYSRSLRCQQARLGNPALTPSAALLEAMQGTDASFFRFALNQSLSHRKWFEQRPLSSSEVGQHQARAQQSFSKQAQLEAQTQISFDAFLKNYLKLPE